MARGRPRKLGVPRDPRTGRIASGFDRQSPEAITAVAEEARIRQLLGVDTYLKARRNEKALEAARKKVSDPLLGCAMGCFLYSRQISRDQYEAGAYFAYIWEKWAPIRGVPSPNIRGIDYSAVRGLSTHPEKSDGWANDIKRRWEEAQAALFNANGDHGRTAGDVYAILKRTLVENIGPQNAYELGNLRTGLNALNQARGV